MSSVSEQDHLNPRDPLYYAPRLLRERSASLRETDRLDVAYSALRRTTVPGSKSPSPTRCGIRSIPKSMREPEEEKALWSVAARFAAAIGVAAVVALFFVIVVPGVRQGSDGEASTAVGLAQSIRAALFQSESSPKPAINDFQAILASTPPDAPSASDPQGQLLQQFMQWREKPDPAAPQRTNP